MQVTEMDALCETIARTRKEIAELEEQVDLKKASIKEIEDRVEQFFIETGRTAPYNSPYGTLYLHTQVTVLQPKGEKLKAIFDHFVQLYGEEVAWQRMSVNNNSLKSWIKEHDQAVEERGGDPLLETFPGVEPPKTLKTLKFRKAKV